MPYWLLMVLVTLIFWGGTGVTQKFATNHLSSRLTFFWYAMAFIPVALGLLFASQVSWAYSTGTIALGLSGGLLLGLATLPLFLALERGGKASIVVPLVALYPLLTVLLALVFLGEQLGARQWLGIFLAIIAGVLLSQE